MSPERPDILIFNVDVFLKSEGAIFYDHETIVGSVFQTDIFIFLKYSLLDAMTKSGVVIFVYLGKDIKAFKHKIELLCS